MTLQADDSVASDFQWSRWISWCVRLIAALVLFIICIAEIAPFEAEENFSFGITSHSLKAALAALAALAAWLGVLVWPWRSARWRTRFMVATGAALLAAAGHWHIVS